MKFRVLLQSLCIVLTAGVCSCSKSDSDPSVNPVETNRTVLVYIAANNSLGVNGNDEKDLSEMKRAVLNGALGTNNRLIIYHAAADGSQNLFEMVPDGSLNLLTAYDGSQSSVSAARMLTVMNDAKRFAPAKDYGLIMWSHALGWTQNGVNEDASNVTVKTWGDDRGMKMNITTLRQVLAQSPWRWIYFDCCFMGSVEVAFELSEVTDIMVASATEVPLDGMPYDKNLALFFKPDVDLIQAAQNTFDYYDGLTGSNRTCTIGVYDLTAMQGLAEATLSIYQKSTKVGVNDFPNLPLETYMTATPCRYYDLGVYVDGLCKTNNLDESLWMVWKGIYDRTIMFSKATPRLWNIIDLSDFTGMSTFIPDGPDDVDKYGYDTLLWYQLVAKWLYDK